MNSFFKIFLANRNRVANAIAIKMKERKASDVKASFLSSYKA
jgi:hypothetical protein